MVQTVKSLSLLPNQQKMFFERPHALSRVFFKITTTLPPTANYMSEVSFDDPLFLDYYTLLGSSTCFEAKGDGIFQGNIFVRNVSSINIFFTTTEILI